MQVPLERQGKKEFRMNRSTAACVLCAIFMLGGCGSSNSDRIAAANTPEPGPEAAAQPPAEPTVSAPAVAQPHIVTQPRIVTPPRRMQCVPYARAQSGIAIRGDAWTWWDRAAGSYVRSAQPAVGAVIVFSRTGRNRYGHLAVVTEIVNDREIIARHANWLNKGRIHLDTPIHDVSRDNDWSSVRVWYTPGNVLGRRNYPVSGFILPPPQQASD